MTSGIPNMWSFSTSCLQVTWHGACAVNFWSLTWANATLNFWGHVSILHRYGDIKPQTRDPKIFEAPYLRIRARYAHGHHWSPIGKCPRRVRWSRDRWYHVTPKGQNCNPNMFGAPYLRNGARQMHGSNGPPIGNHICRVQWPRDRWRHMTPKGQTRDPKIFEAPYLRTRAR